MTLEYPKWLTPCAPLRNSIIASAPARCSSLHAAIRTVQNQFDPACQFLQHFIQILHALAGALINIFQVELWPGDATATGRRVQVYTKYK